MAKTAGMTIVAVLLAALGGYRPDRKQSQQSSVQQPSAMPNSAASPRLEFEVAVIKPGVPSETDAGVKPDPGGQTYRAQNMPLQLMIRLMWKLNDTQVVGGPDWLTKDYWDIEAKADRPRSLDDLHTMFQNMIIDRYKMRFHWDTRDVPIYALVQDKSGERMKLNTDPEPFASYPILGAGFGRLEAEHCDMAYFTWFLSTEVARAFGILIDRPVVDETGLDKSTSYDFILQFAPELSRGAAETGNLPPAPGPDFFKAIREQLGLRLESKRGPVPVMVIDHIEKPNAADN